MKTKKRRQRLPNIPSKLIRLAVKDLEVVESKPRYVIGMGSWHEARNNTCEVCLAGAVIANSLKISPLNKDRNDYPTKTFPDCFDDRTSSKLKAIDAFRAGNIYTGLEHMGVNPIPRKAKQTFQITSYYISPERFKIDMLKLADNLKSMGL